MGTDAERGSRANCVWVENVGALSDVYVFTVRLELLVVEALLSACHRNKLQYNLQGTPPLLSSSRWSAKGRTNTHDTKQSQHVCTEAEKSYEMHASEMQ